MMTFNKLKQLVRLPDNAQSQLANLPTVNTINEAIIGLLMAAIKSDMGALQFCDAMESIVDSKSSKEHITTLRNGNRTEFSYLIIPTYLIKQSFIFITVTAFP